MLLVRGLSLLLKFWTCTGSGGILLASIVYLIGEMFLDWRGKLILFLLLLEFLLLSLLSFFVADLDRFLCYSASLSYSTTGMVILGTIDLGNINSLDNSSSLLYCWLRSLLGFFSYLTLSAYFNVFRVFSQLWLPGEMFPIITVRQYPTKESFNTIVNLLPRKGVWFLFWSKALIHSFKASKDLFISAPSNLVCCDCWSA